MVFVFSKILLCCGDQEVRNFKFWLEFHGGQFSVGLCEWVFMYMMGVCLVTQSFCS